MPALEAAFLRYSGVRGALACRLLDTAPRLERLSVSGNRLTGTLPACFLQVRTRRLCCARVRVRALCVCALVLCVSCASSDALCRLSCGAGGLSVRLSVRLSVSAWPPADCALRGGA
jgi:hypothetical protein